MSTEVRQWITSVDQRDGATAVSRLETSVGHGVRLPDNVYRAVAEMPYSVLLETSRVDSENRCSYLFLHPKYVVSANRLEEIPSVFARIEAALADGLHVAGFFSYECGYHFQPGLADTDSSRVLPLVWLGIYDKPFVFDHAQGWVKQPPVLSLSQTREPKITAPASLNLEITKEEYCKNILKIKEYIAAGDTYQVNFTDRVSFQTHTSPEILFEELCNEQPTAYSAFMNVGGCYILSFSPELFFRIDEKRIVTRPMKGTMPRGPDINDDARAMSRLRNDEKNRSEHVMIVDLLRNDLGRICSAGSVQVQDLFSVEKYQHLLQMTSTIAGILRPNIGLYEIFQSLFPSGSVTGAPKIRTMQIIRELERKPREIYTGAIGYMSPDRSSVFNVAIRTLLMRDGTVQMGVGGGVVADSEPEGEYRECQLKASFLSRRHRDCQLIETMLWERAFRFLSMHLDRLESSAAYFDFPFCRQVTLAHLKERSTSFRCGRQYRVRVLLSSTGEIIVESRELAENRWIGYVMLSQERTSSDDVFCRHKTTLRDRYDREYAKARAIGFDEVLFMNERNEITEGAISNIFIKRAGSLWTPPLACGVLPGIFRRVLLENQPFAKEKVLTVSDLETADAVFLCNSVRGMRMVKTLCVDASQIARLDESA